MTEENKETAPEPSGNKSTWGCVAVVAVALIGINVLTGGLSDLGNMNTAIAGTNRILFGALILIVAVIGFAVWAFMKTTKGNKSERGQEKQ